MLEDFPKASNILEIWMPIWILKWIGQFGLVSALFHNSSPDCHSSSDVFHDG